MGYRVAVVGATGNVGREMLNILEELNFPIDEIHAIASRTSKGIEVSFGDRTLSCVELDSFDFSKVDIVLMSAGGKVSREWSEKIGKAGPVVIDNSSAWRMNPDVPLIVPEVNPDAIEGFRKKNIIANPNCSTAQLVMALKPLHDEAPIKRVVVSTYQSVSGAGKAAMDELWNQTKGVFVLGPSEPRHFPKQIAFNVIPYIGTFLPDGYTDEEAKMWLETKKILDPSIELTVTCVRVPVFVGHSESVNVEFHEPLDEDEAREALRDAPGVQVIDKRDETGYVTPKECVGEFDVFVSRIRKDPTVEHGINMWVVADNLRKGAALNAVQIAQLLHERGLIEKADA
jgi:aspartate-semialdehyde dehydrogenase